MKYVWLIRLWVEQFLPAYLRKPKRIALHYVLCKPGEEIYDAFNAERERINGIILHNSQRLSLESRLNDLFDPTSRRIEVITNDDAASKIYIYSDSTFVYPEELVHIFSDIEIDPDVDIIYSDSEVVSQTDITIETPSSLTSRQGEMDAWLRFYKLAGRTHDYNYV
jgi:hypothetical protein